MANFIYRIDTHLLRPSNIVSNITYQANSTASPLTFSLTASETSVITSPFDGNAVNLNFFNLAMAVTDLTYQSIVFQGYSNNVESTSFGFVNYNGRQELESDFYGGSPFTLTGATLFTVPYIMDNTTTKAFQIASLNGILYAAGSVDQVYSMFRALVLGEAGQGSPFSTPTALTTYMNSRLKFNSNDGTNAFTIVGNANPLANYATTWGLITSLAPRSFYVWWNDGYTQYANALTFTDSSGYIHTQSLSGPVVGAKVTLTQAPANNLTAVQVAVQNLLTIAIGNSNTFAVVQNGSFLTLNISNDRTQNGIFQVTLQKDAGDSGTGMLEWMGWINSVSKATNQYPIAIPANTSEAYDYTSILQFVPAGVGPYNLTLAGIGSYAPISFIDNYAGGTALLASFGFPTATTTYYHTRRPATTYLKTLNYGGPFWATTINATGSATINGNLSIGGSINANSVSYTLPSYISNSGFEFNTINNVAPALWAPYANASASATPTSGGATTVYTYTVTFTSNPGGTVFINGVSVSISSALTTATFIAQFLGTLAQAGYVFNYTGTNTFTIAVSGPYANPTVVNGTLTSGMVSFGVTNTFGIPNNAVTILANNVSPLYGTFDAVISKPATINGLGQGYATSFAIDRGATGQPFQLTFYYNTSANYLSGDLSVFVYDVTNASLIPLSISAIPSSPQASLFVATFYPSSSLNYRFLLHISSTNATGWTFEFDMLSIAPQSPLLAVMSALNGMTSFPMVLTASTTAPTRGTGVVEYAGWKRNIDQMELVWTYSQTGAGTAGLGTIFWSLPSGISIDLTKYPIGSTIGIAGLTNNTNSAYALGAVQVASATTLQIGQISITTSSFIFGSQVPFTQLVLAGPSATLSATAPQSAQALATFTGSNNVINFGIANIAISFQVKVSVTQWSSQINLATDFTEYASNTDTTASNSGVATITTIYNGKDGAPFPVGTLSAPGGPAPIFKRVQFARPMQITDVPYLEVYDKTNGQWFPTHTNSAGSLAYQNQNGILAGMWWQPVAGSSTQFDVAFGPYARLTGSSYGATGETWTNYSNGVNAISRWRMRKIANGNTAEQLPIVRAEYQIQDHHVIEASGAVVNFGTKIEDTHSAVTTGAGVWKYTAPVTGLYVVHAYVETNLGQYNQWDGMGLDLYKNGQEWDRLSVGTFTAALASGFPIRLIGSAEIRLNTGDYIDIRIPYLFANGAHPTKWSREVASVTGSTIVMFANIAPDCPQTGVITFLHLPSTILSFTYTSWATTTFSGVLPAPNSTLLTANDLKLTTIPRIQITRIGN